MSLPRLYARPTTPEEWMAWAWNHQANHFDIVQAGTRFQQVSVTAVTNAVTLSGNKVLQFAAVPSQVKAGMSATDETNPGSITGGSEVTGFTSTLVEIGLPVPSNLASGDTILFSPGANVLALVQYQLSPVDPNNLGMWLYVHSLMHAQINQVLGTQGFNLLTYDFDDPAQFQEFLQANGDEHVRLCSALGIG